LPTILNTARLSDKFSDPPNCMSNLSDYGKVTEEAETSTANEDEQLKTR